MSIPSFYQFTCQPIKNEYLQLEGSRSLLKEIWIQIFSYVSLNNLLQYRAVNKSWNCVITEVLNKKLQYFAEKTSLLFEKEYQKNKEWEEIKNKPINWEEIYFRELASDRCLLDNEICLSSETLVRFPQSSNEEEYDSPFVCGDSLIVRQANSKEEFATNSLYFFHAQANKTIISSCVQTPLQISEISKLSETKFLIKGVNKNDQNAMLLYEMSSYLNPKEPPRSFAFQSNSSLIHFPYLDEKNLILTQGCEQEGTLFFRLKVYSLLDLGKSCKDYLLPGPKMENVSRIYDFNVRHATQGHICIQVSCHLPQPSLMFFYDLEKERLLFSTFHPVVEYTDTIVLLFDKTQEQLVEVDLKKSEIILQPLFPIKNCEAAYIDSFFYYIIGDNKLFVYDIEKKSLWSESLIDQEEHKDIQIESATFIRVTEHLIMIHLTLESSTNFEQVRLYRLKDRTPQFLYKIQSQPDESYIIGDSYIFSKNMKDEESDERFLKAYQYKALPNTRFLHPQLSIIFKEPSADKKRKRSL